MIGLLHRRTAGASVQHEDDTAARMADWLSKVHPNQGDQPPCDHPSSIPKTNCHLPQAHPNQKKRKPATMDEAVFDESAVPTPRKIARHDAGRGRNLRQGSRDQLPPSPATPAMNLSQRAHSTASTSLSSATSRSAVSRSSSPAKRKFNLRLTQPAIIFEPRYSIERLRRAPLSESLFALLEEATDREFPATIKTRLSASRNPFKSRAVNVAEKEMDEDNTNELWRLVLKMDRYTTKCLKEKLNEDAWSDLVVLPILQFALECLKEDESQVELVNVKSIDIQPRTLLPSVRETGLTIGTKRIDYMFALNLPNEREARSILADMYVPGSNNPSFSQTDHDCLRERPTFSDLEIKKPLTAMDGEEQIGVWCAAGFKKREEFIRLRAGTHPKDLPLMPLWLVDDKTWNLYLGIRDSDDEIVIAGPLCDWSTDRKSEIVRLIYALTAVMKWGVHSYLPWFMESINYQNTEQGHPG